MGKMVLLFTISMGNQSNGCPFLISSVSIFVPFISWDQNSFDYTCSVSVPRPSLEKSYVFISFIPRINTDNHCCDRRITDILLGKKSENLKNPLSI